MKLIRLIDLSHKDRQRMYSLINNKKVIKYRDEQDYACVLESDLTKKRTIGRPKKFIKKGKMPKNAIKINEKKKHTKLTVNVIGG